MSKGKLHCFWLSFDSSDFKNLPDSVHVKHEKSLSQILLPRHFILVTALCSNQLFQESLNSELDPAYRNWKLHFATI